MNRIKSQYLSLAFYSALFLGVVVLSVLQLGWVTQASEQQLEAAQKAVALEVTKTMDAISSDIQLLVLQELNEAQGNSRLFTEHKVIDYQSGWQSYPDDERSQLIERLDPYVGQSSTGAMLRALNEQQAGNQLNLLELAEGRGLSRKASFRIHLLTIDAQAVLHPALLELIQTSLPNYEFELINNGQTLFSSLPKAPPHAPEVGVSVLGSLRLPPLQSRGNLLTYRESPVTRNLGQTDRDDELLASPNIFVFYDRVLKSIVSANDIQQFGSGIVLTVYNPEGPLSQISERQRLLNSLFSSGILLLLSITAVVLILAIRKLRMLRDRERDFVASVNHELRTPLTVIRSAADNLGHGIVKAESVQRYGEEIIRQSKRLERMIESTLFYSGLPSQTRAQYSEVLSTSFFQNLLAPLQQLADDQQTQLNLTQTIERPKIRIDTDAVRLIIENLFMNAIVHGKPEQGRAAIWLDIEVQEKLIISVADNGPGIPKNEQRKIFAAFNRGKRSIEQQHTGSGLGLNLIQRMARLLGGDIQLQSPYLSKLNTQQQGALLRVELPLSEAVDV